MDCRSCVGYGQVALNEKLLKLVKNAPKLQTDALMNSNESNWVAIDIMFENSMDKWIKQIKVIYFYYFVLNVC